MEISYDKKYNIAYIKIQEKISKVQTITLSDEVNIDISPDGKLYGIELLNANNQLKPTDNEFDICYRATSDADTIINHSYKTSYRFGTAYIKNGAGS